MCATSRSPNQNDALQIWQKRDQFFEVLDAVQYLLGGGCPDAVSLDIADIPRHHVPNGHVTGLNASLVKLLFQI